MTFFDPHPSFRLLRKFNLMIDRMMLAAAGGTCTPRTLTRRSKAHPFGRWHLWSWDLVWFTAYVLVLALFILCGDMTKYSQY